MDNTNCPALLDVRGESKSTDQPVSGCGSVGVPSVSAHLQGIPCIWRQLRKDGVIKQNYHEDFGNKEIVQIHACLTRFGYRGLWLFGIIFDLEVEMLQKSALV